MKKPNYLAALFFGAALSFVGVSCDNGDDAQPEVIKPGADDAVGPIFREELNQLKQTFTLNGANGGFVFGKEGTRIRFNAGSLKKQNGEAVTGDVTVELVEIYNRANMLLSNMPTQGRNSESQIATLVSGGEFYINVKQGTEQLVLDGTYEIAAPTDKTGGIDDTMKPFAGKEECDNNNNCRIVWQEQDRGLQIGKMENGAGGVSSAYFTFQSQFGWTNIDRWYSDPRDKTTIFVEVPEGYNNTNCAVYLSYDGEPTALASFDRYDETTKRFTEHYGLIPIGLQVHFIMVSVIDGQWYYAIKGATIGQNHVETFTELQPISEADLRTAIEDLP